MEVRVLCGVDSDIVRDRESKGVCRQLDVVVEISGVFAQVLQKPRSRLPLVFIVPVHGRNVKEFMKESTIRPPFVAISEERERPFIQTCQFHNW